MNNARYLLRIALDSVKETESILPGTLTDLDSSCPGSILKTAPPPPGYPWLSGGRYVSPEPRFSGLVLNNQGLEEPELKNTQKLLLLIKFGSF